MGKEAQQELERCKGIIKNIIFPKDEASMNPKLAQVHLNETMVFEFTFQIYNNQ